MSTLCLISASLLFVASVFSAQFDDSHHNHAHHSGCGTPDPSPDQLKALQSRLKQYEVRHQNRASKQLCIGCVNIDVIIHVIEDSRQESDTSKYATDENIVYQMDILNEQFNATPFQFSHIKTTRMIDDEWVYGEIREESGNVIENITSFLREGGADVANVFIVHGAPSGCNLATLPSTDRMFPIGTYTKNDYIFLCGESIARSDNVFYFENGWRYEESTLTHEVGHWLGLLHTFEGDSCLKSNLNDLVSDTPQQSGPTDPWCLECCLKKIDTCPKLPGKDPVNNFMDYSPCTSEFTPGQIRRMYDEFNEFRRRLEPCSKGEADVQVELRLGNNPEGTSLDYVTWGLDEYSYRMIKMEPQIDFANKVLVRKMCIPRQILYEFAVTDMNFLKDPAYFTIKMNKQTLVRFKNLDTQSASVFLSGDSAQCSKRESRFQLQILFDEDYSITWEVRNSKNNALIVDQSATQGYQAGMYWKNFYRTKLFFDKCLSVGDYTFTIYDKYPYFTGFPSYFIVSKDGKQIGRGGANGGKAKETVKFSVTKAF